MKTIILCGGKGTRIRGLDDHVPKPMIKIGPYPILYHIMKHYSHYGFNEFICALGYLGWKIKEYFLNYNYINNDFTLSLNKPNDITFSDFQSLDMKISLIDTGLNTMTGGRIAKLKKYIGDDEHFFVTYGDGISDVNLEELLLFHKKHGKLVTVTGIQPRGRWGELQITESMQVSQFSEKPQNSEGRINGGFFVFSNKEAMWKHFPLSEDLILEQDPLINIAKDGELMMFPHNDFWQAMDNYREYIILNELWDKNHTSHNLWYSS